MKTFSILLGLIAVAFFTIGCAQSETKTSGSTKTQNDNPGTENDPANDGHDHAAHDHSPKHGGQLIDIGRNHEYHAEFVDHHQTESVTVYMMDSHMKPLMLNQASISLVLTAGDKTETFELLASQPGGAAEFSSNDARMMEIIEGEDVKGKLRITIDGKPFSGTFDHHAHNHGEAGDSHAGHNH